VTNPTIEAASLRRLARKLEARGKPGDELLARKARMKATHIEAGPEKNNFPVVELPKDLQKGVRRR
jgi:hypothetical protein